MHQLVIKGFSIVDARCNHEGTQGVYEEKNVYDKRRIYELDRLQENVEFKNNKVCFVLRNKDWNAFRKLGNWSANFGMWKGQHEVERRSHKVWRGSGSDS